MRLGQNLPDNISVKLLLASFGSRRFPELYLRAITNIASAFLVRSFAVCAFLSSAQPRGRKPFPTDMPRPSPNNTSFQNIKENGLTTRSLWNVSVLSSRRIDKLSMIKRHVLSLCCLRLLCLHCTAKIFLYHGKKAANSEFTAFLFFQTVNN